MADKFSSHLHIRLTDAERERLETLMQEVGADRSSITRLAIKRLLRKPPVKRFRYRLRRGPKV